MQETIRDVGSIPGSVRSSGGGMATHSSILAWKNPWAEEPGEPRSVGSQRVIHDWVTLHTGMHWLLFDKLSYGLVPDDRFSLERDAFNCYKVAAGLLRVIGSNRSCAELFISKKLSLNHITFYLFIYLFLNQNFKGGYVYPSVWEIPFLLIKKLGSWPS